MKTAPAIPRNQSLDSLRGLAILAMVLSSNIAFGILPAWMYHAQEPPPTHVFDPELPGISWVDLVFPFFLFSMGAAFPLAFYKRLKTGEPARKIAGHIVQRYALLVFFAIFTFHARAWVISAAPDRTDQLLSIGCFVLLFFMYVQWKDGHYKRLLMGVRVLAFVLAGAFLFLTPFSDGKGLQLHHSDIIILVLANMALFGSLVWLATRHQPLLRLGILPFIMAVFLGSKVEGSWNSSLYNWSPVSWAYQFYFLKYLFLILPGTFAGEWLLTRMQQGEGEPVRSRHPWMLVAVIALVLIVGNTIFLFARYTVLNLLVTTGLLGGLLYLLRQREVSAVYSCRRKLALAGAYLLLLGLFFEAYEGGVKKDPSTYSYYFITGGLAFMALLAFDIGGQFPPVRPVAGYLALVGKNPMVAYVAGNLLLLPLLRFSGAMTFYEGMGTGVWLGVLRGLLFTGIVSLVAVGMVKKKWLWKT